MEKQKYDEKIIVSVVVPTFNQEQYVQDTIMSIVRQECNFRYEIIVVDDCSIDNTYEKCKLVAEKYPEIIRLYKNSKNLGLLGNYFNALIPKCRGEFIAGCAGDDVWNDPNKLKIQVDYLQNHPDCSCLHTGYIREYENSKKKEVRNTWDSPLLHGYGKKMAIEVVKENFSTFPVASSLIYRKSILDTYNVFINKALVDPFKRGEAMILFPIFAMTGKYAFLPEPMVSYRVREESASHFTDPRLKEKFELFYLFQKLNTIRLLNLGFGIKLKFNIKVIKFFLRYAKNSLNIDLNNYLNQYKKSPTFNLYPGVDVVIGVGLRFRKELV